MQILASISAALLFAVCATAETIRIHPKANTALCAGPAQISQVHSLDVLTCGTSNATSSDVTALTVSTTEAGQQTTLSFGDMCVENIQDGTVNGDAYFVPCVEGDGELLWEFRGDGTIANIHDLCLTVGRPGKNAPVSLSPCGQFPDLEGWVLEVLDN